MKKPLLFILIIAAALGAAGCGGAKPASTADEPSALTASADEAQQTTAAKKNTKKVKQHSDGKVQETTKLNTGELFGKFKQLFERSGTGWGAYLRVNPDGSFALTYHKNVKAQGSAAGTTVNTSSFTGRFSDVKKFNAYFYTMRVTDVKFKEKTGTKKKSAGKEYTYTNETVGLKEGSTITLFAPDTPTDKLTGDYLYYSKVPAGIPNGNVLGGYCFQADDGKPYYSTNQ